MMKTRITVLFFCLVATHLNLGPSASHAQQSSFQQNQTKQQASQKRAIPRFVSLKKNRVNLRRGPSTTHKVEYVFTKLGLPVEVIAEFDLWRRIRDSEGDEGWVYHTLLSGTRNVLIAPWDKNKTIPLFKSEDKKSDIIAYAETGVLGNARACNGKKCLVVINEDIKGWVSQTSLWGVYPDETF